MQNISEGMSETDVTNPEVCTSVFHVVLYQLRRYVRLQLRPLSQDDGQSPKKEEHISKSCAMIRAVWSHLFQFRKPVVIVII
jgi:hypothetical protein